MMAVGIVFCIGECAVSMLAGRYFKNELAAGTVFTFEGANEMKRLGIVTICVPIGASVAAGIVYGIMKLCFKDVGNIDFGDFVSVGLGVMFIVTSLICRHGAELTANGGDGSAEGE